MANRKNLVGMKFERLTVISYSYTDSKSHRTYWKCKCDCGNEIVKATNLLTTGLVKSCGCLLSDKRHINTYKHGACINNKETRLYKIWANMKYRCSKPGNQMAAYYYDKGIRVCEEWVNDFDNFRKWAIENGYSDDLTIDRINSDGNYCPENCRWATKEEQIINRKNINHFLEYQGKTQTLSQWSRELNISRTTLTTYISKGMNLYDVVEYRKR